jgi:hypothetical protein
MKCNICDLQFDNLNSLQEHKLTHNKNIATSQQQQQQLVESAKKRLAYQQTPSPISPTQLQQQQQQVTCNYCRQPVTDEYQFREHFYKHNSSTASNNIYTNSNCIICRQILNSESDLILHIKYHLRSVYQQHKSPEVVLSSSANNVASTNNNKINDEFLINCSICRRLLNKKQTEDYDFKTDLQTNKLFVACKLCTLRYVTYLF